MPSSLSIRSLRQHIGWEVYVYAGLLLIALALRLWDLDYRAFHYDEGLHSLYAWRLFTGLGYNHEPWMHGPFQFYGTYPIYWLFGASDYTARLLPVLFGTAVVGLPYFLRHQLGRWGALSVAVLLTLSPLLLYYSRYARNDIYIVFFSLLLVVCMWRYFEERKARYLYIGSAALSLSFCAKEVTYVTVGILAIFLFVISAKGLLVWFRSRFDSRELSPQGEVFILIGTLSLPLFSAFIQLIPGVDLPSGFHWAKLITVVVFLIISLEIGLVWNWRRWLISALIFYGIFILLHTSFFSNTGPGLASGFWGSVDYWWAQHGVSRGGQPYFYYFVLLPIYEFLPLLFAFIGGIYYAIKGDLFSRFLVFWAALGFILYSYFGEKMPWLSLHLALPVILLGGMFIGRIIRGFDAKGMKILVLRACAALIVLALFSYTVNVAIQENYQKGDEPPQMLLYAGVSSDVPPVMKQIEELAKESGEGYELSITLDSGLYYNGPAWYLRDYTNVDFDATNPRGSVLILHEDTERDIDKSKLEAYGEGQRFRHLMWFPEEYRNFSLGWWWGYFLNRDTNGSYRAGGAQDAFIYFRSTPP